MSRTIYPFQVASLAACALLLGAAACTPEDIDSVAFDRAPLLEDTPKCEDLDCGKNAGTLNGFPFREFNTLGLPNADGFRVFNFAKNGKYYTLDVDNGEFRALDAFGQVALSGIELVGSHFEVSNGNEVWEMEIAGYTSSLQYWVGPPAYLSAYRMRYRPLNTSLPWVDLCKDPRSVTNDPTWVNGGYETYVVLIEGELYDYEAIAVRQGVETKNWVSIPCAGTALAKMMMMRYNPAIPEGKPYHTTWEERQATIKMITSDACGIGAPFTVTGWPLLWANDAGWHTVNPNDVDTDEAVWTKDGAYCLDVPRLSSHPEYPGIYDKIQATCQIPTCANVPDWTLVGEWKTFNPIP